MTYEFQDAKINDEIDFSSMIEYISKQMLNTSTFENRNICHSEDNENNNNNYCQ